MSPKIEELTHAEIGQRMVVDNLREALKTASNVEGLAILAAIHEAAKLHSAIKELRAAVEADQQPAA